MKIQPIVEGHGEVTAIPVLLRRLRDEAGCYELDVNAPHRRNRPDLVDESRLRRWVRVALESSGCDAILIVLDADDDCPKEVAPQLQLWAQSEAAGVHCAVVMANREFESWFLATLESLRGKRDIRPDAEALVDPETAPRDAKGKISEWMKVGRSYSPTVDQAALTALFDLATAFARCRSFRRLVQAFGQLATRTGAVLNVWPPTAWQESFERENPDPN